MSIVSTVTHDRAGQTVLEPAAVAVAVPAATAPFLRTLTAAALRGGAQAIAKLLQAGSSAGPLKALLASPQGRAAVIGAVIGYAWGEEHKVPVRAANAALARIATDGTLTAPERARQVTQVLRSLLDAVNGGDTAPSRPDPGRQAAVRPLQQSLQEARASLAETTRLLKLNPADTDLQKIREAQQQKADRLQAQLDALQPPRQTTRPKPQARASTQTSTPVQTTVTPPTLSTPRPKPPPTVARQRNDQALQQARTQAFMKELQQLDAIRQRDREARVQELVNTRSTEDLRDAVRSIDAVLKTEGYGHVYAHDERAPASVKKDPAYVQYPWRGALLMRDDLEYIARALREHLARVDATAAKAPSTAGTASAAPVAPLTRSLPPPEVVLVDRLPGRTAPVEFWFDPITGRVQAEDPRDGRSLRMAAEMAAEIDPEPGGRLQRQPAPIVLYVKEFYAKFSPPSPSPGGGPEKPRWPGLAGALTLAASGLATLVFLHYQLDSLAGSKIDTDTPAKRNAALIDGMVDGGTSLAAATTVRNQIWTNYLDAAMASLRDTRVGGPLGYLVRRFSDEELAALQKQVDDFKASLERQPPLAASDAQQPTLRFDVNAGSDYVKKTEAAETAFDLVNRLATRDTKRLALRFFGGSDSAQPYARFDLAGRLAQHPEWTRQKPPPGKALAALEQDIYRFYLVQVPALLAWPPGGAQDRAYRASLAQWLGNDANFERGGERLSTRDVSFYPAVVLDADSARQLDLKLAPLMMQARQDINGLRQRFGTAQVPATGLTPSDLRRQLEASQQQARNAVEPFARQFEGVRQAIERVAPNDALPASVRLTPGTQPVPRPEAQALLQRMDAADRQLLTAERQLNGLRNTLIQRAAATQGSDRTAYSELLTLVEARLATVRDLRRSLRDDKAALDQRVAPLTPPNVAPESPVPPVQPLPLPTVPVTTPQALPEPSTEASPTPLPTTSPSAPANEVTPMPRPTE